MRIYNSQTRQKEELVPIKEGEISIYSCGPTVYNYFHLGNARPFILFDCLRRYLEFRGYKVNFVQNFTDIDDKMINRANEEDITVKELADRFIAEYFKDAQGLGIKEATVHPRATENIDAIIDIIEKLIEKGYAYEKNGDVYYRTRKFAEYGKLSHMPIEDLEAGARIDVSDVKEDPLDFALWKGKKEGEPFWESPFGEGRPGWHIECSAMANKYLGKTIDIHSGGMDLSFPHHENEIAQSEAANGVPFAHYWMHNAYINIDNQKMSKSKGNFFTVREISEKYGYEAIRFFMLSSHYRSPINFSEEILKSAAAGLERLKNCRRNLEFLLGSAAGELTAEEEQLLGGFDRFETRFCEVMDDDLNTADAVSVLFDFARELNIATEERRSRAFLEAALAKFVRLCDVLGVVRPEERSDEDEKIEAMVKERAEARAAKDFARADRLRDELTAMGIVMEDTKDGVKWHRA